MVDTVSRTQETDDNDGSQCPGKEVNTFISEKK